MTTTLGGVQIPDGYNGIGLHDSPGTGAGVWTIEQAREHARSLLRHGVRGYKIFTEGQKLSRVMAYHEAGILTMVRRYNGPYVWGRDPRTWVSQPAWFGPFVDAGVQLFEEGNEWNIDCEWANSHTPQDPKVIARTVVDMWEIVLERLARYPTAVPMFPSNTPGGNLDHRVCYPAICEELRDRGLGPTVRHVAIHPRPHNNPPHATWTSTNTVTFDEWRWIRDQFLLYGMMPWFWATEHGYSLGDAQNQNYPPIDRRLHTDYNWELSMRMNPHHSGYIERELAGVFHWYEAGWGHYGDWAKDALVDSPDPRMGRPSELWRKMENESQYMDWDRYPWPHSLPPVAPPIIDLTDRLPKHPQKVYGTRDLADITRIIIHHTGHRGRRRRVKPETIARIHVGWGWPGVGYHFEIMPNGTIYRLNRNKTAAHHAGKRYNPTSIGIVLSGNFAWQGPKGGDRYVLDPTTEQVNACRELCTWLKKQIPSVSSIDFHKKLKGMSTRCPGRVDEWGHLFTEGIPWA